MHQLTSDLSQTRGPGPSGSSGLLSSYGPLDRTSFAEHWRRQVFDASRLNGSGNGAAVAAPPVGIDTPLDGRDLAALAKRAFDLFVTGLVLLLAAPLLLAIALAIKGDSPGPVFFRQSRVGRDGQLFAMLKFRTMVEDAEAQKHSLRHMNEAADGLFKIAHDPRLTRVGAVLRSMSLDELPQLFHVLTGRMSLVGPRPLVPEEDLLIVGSNRRRLTVRPGLTGPWQVAAGDERISLWEMALLDSDYVDAWTLRSDLRVLFQTVPHVVGRRGL